MKKIWFILRILCTVSIIGYLFSGCNTQGDGLETQNNIEDQNQIEDSESEKADNNKISKEQQKSYSKQKEENQTTTSEQKNEKSNEAEEAKKEHIQTEDSENKTVEEDVKETDSDKIVNNEELKHQHTYSSLWLYNETYHWHQATCEHKDEVSDLSEHSYDEGHITNVPTTDQTGVLTYTCKVCGYKKNISVAKLKKHSFYLIGSSVREIKNAQTTFGKVYSYNYMCSNCGVTCTKHEGGRIGCTAAQWAAMREGLSVQDSLDNIDFNKKSNEVCTAYSDSIVLQGEIFTISYILNGGTNNNENPTEYTTGSSIILKDPVKLGEVFYGWYEDESFSGNRIYKIESTSASDRTFYAKWKIDSYTITFDTQGGSAIVPQVVPSNVKTLKPQNPTKENFDFVYWYYYDEYNQEREYYFGEYPGQNITLYAKWKAKPVSVPLSVSVLPESDIEVTKTQTENGYSFSVPSGYAVLGWYWDNIQISTESTISLGSDKLTKGTHILSLEAKTGDKYRSYTAEIKVE